MYQGITVQTFRYEDSIYLDILAKRVTCADEIWCRRKPANRVDAAQKSYFSGHMTVTAMQLTA